MLKIRYTNQFKKDYELIKKRGYNIQKLKDIIELLADGKKLPSIYKEHNLKGNYIRI